MTLPEPIPIHQKCFCKGRGLESVLRNQEEKIDKDRKRKLEGTYEEEKEQV